MGDNGKSKTLKAVPSGAKKTRGAARYGRWFRMYEEAVEDPKIQTLGDGLGFFWMNCMCLASRGGGSLPPVADIAWKLRKTTEEVSAMLAALYEKGLLEEDGLTFRPHNWDQRQFLSDLSTERVRDFRNKQKAFPETDMKRSETVSETVSETAMKRDDDVSKLLHETPSSVSVSVSDSVEEKDEAKSEESEASRLWLEFSNLYPQDRFDDQLSAQFFFAHAKPSAIVDGLKRAVLSELWNKADGKYVCWASKFIAEGKYSGFRAREPTREAAPVKYFDPTELISPTALRKY